MCEFIIVAAVDSAYGIGTCNDIPWRKTLAGSCDMKFFYKLTSAEHGKNAVVMGSRTAQSIPSQFWPLIYRFNIVISRQKESYYGILGAPSGNLMYAENLDSALSWCKKLNMSKVFVIGGAQIYSVAIRHPLCRGIYLTNVTNDYSCDTKFDTSALGLYRQIDESDHSHDSVKNLFASYHKNTSCTLSIYAPNNKSEEKYLKLLSKCIAMQARNNRTGVPTRGDFGVMLRFPLSDCRGPILPLLTTKKVILKSVFHELVWFLRGDTDITYLKDNNVNIWNQNTSREFLNKIGHSDYPEGTVGPAYGFSWRHYGGDWKDPLVSPGIDQIENLINGLISDPESRRHIVTAWNPIAVPECALPPCHMGFQMYVGRSNTSDTNDKKLSCKVIMRSSDLFLGLPFNIASYALLTHIIAKITGYIPGELIFDLGDYHVYENQIDAVKTQLARTPRIYPTFAFSDRVNNETHLCIDDFVKKFDFSDIIVSDYHPYPFIKCDMIA